MASFHIEAPTSPSLDVLYYRKPQRKAPKAKIQPPRYGDPESDTTQNGAQFLLKLSVFLGIFPNRKFRFWPAVVSVIFIISSSVFVIVDAYINLDKWLAHKETFLRNLLRIGLFVNLNVCLLSQCQSLYQNKEQIDRILEHFCIKSSTPAVFAILQTLSIQLTGLHRAVTTEEGKALAFWVFVSLRNIMAIVVVQFAALVGDLAPKMSILTTNLKSKANTVGGLLSEYYKIVSSVEDVNTVYKNQILFVLSYVFCQVVSDGYFFLTDPDRRLMVRINRIGSIIAEVGLVAYMTTSCQNLQNQTSAFISELYTALRNDPLHPTDSRKLEMIVRRSKWLGFSAGGFIQISNGLLTSMVSAVVTYLVMLVQIQGGFLSDK